MGMANGQANRGQISQFKHHHPDQLSPFYITNFKSIVSWVQVYLLCLVHVGLVGNNSLFMHVPLRFWGILLWIPCIITRFWHRLDQRMLEEYLIAEFVRSRSPIFLQNKIMMQISSSRRSMNYCPQLQPQVILPLIC